jgi:hypothetical protein
MMMEDDEDVLIFNDDKESELFLFIRSIITEIIPKELELPVEEERGNVHATTYGICK